MFIPMVDKSDNAVFGFDARLFGSSLNTSLLNQAVVRIMYSLAPMSMFPLTTQFLTAFCIPSELCQVCGKITHESKPQNQVESPFNSYTNIIVIDLIPTGFILE